MRLTTSYAFMALAAISSVACAPMTQTIYPDFVYQLKTGYGEITTEPIVQNKSEGFFAVGVSFTIPATVPTTATCSLSFPLNGFNSEGSYVVFSPDGTDFIDIYNLITPINTATDTFNNHAETGALAGIMSVRQVESTPPGHLVGIITIEPSTLPCKEGLNQFLMAPANNEIILGWEQSSSLPEGIQYVISS